MVEVVVLVEGVVEGVEGLVVVSVVNIIGGAVVEVEGLGLVITVVAWVVAPVAGVGFVDTSPL